MFVRWKRRERVSRTTYEYRRKGNRIRRVYNVTARTKKGTGKFLLTAVLVQAERREGKPRQKIVAYLASISEDRIDCPFARQNFWRDVDMRLGSLALDNEVRQKVEASLASKVAKMTAEDIEEMDRKNRELMERFSQAMGR